MCRCFATARELGLGQGEQIRLLKLAAEHAAEQQKRAAQYRAAADGANSALPEAAAGEHATPGRESATAQGSRAVPAPAATGQGPLSEEGDLPAADYASGQILTTPAVAVAVDTGRSQQSTLVADEEGSQTSTRTLDGAHGGPFGKAAWLRALQTRLHNELQVSSPCASALSRAHRMIVWPPSLHACQ